MMRGIRRSTTILILLVSVVPAVAQQFNADNWGKGTSGVEMTLHEEPRQRTSKGTILWYNVVGKGFPEGIVYPLWRWTPEKSPEPLMKGVSFDKRGVLVCSGKPGYCSGAGPDDPINIKATAVLGEMKRMAVVSDDGKIAAFVDAAPFPIESSDKNCKLSVTRLSVSADSVVARASGLQINAPLTVTTRYGEQVASSKAS